MKILIKEVLPLLVLIATSAYGAWFANLTNLTNADHLIYPYLIKDLSPHNLVVPAEHANIFKYPLFYIQSLLPYNVYTVTLVNIGLSVTTILLWALLTAYIFGRRYFGLVCIVLSSVVGGSILLNHELLGTTIRNIEYPLALAFVILLSVFATKQKISKKLIAGLSTLSVLLALAIAGDSLLLYAIIAPFAVILGLSYFHQKTPANRKRNLLALAALGATTLLALAIRKLVEISGLAILYKNEQEELTTVPFDLLSPSFKESVHQFLDLAGADIFGKPIDMALVLHATNLLLMLVGVVGIAIIIKITLTKTPLKIAGLTAPKSLTVAVFSLSFVSVWVVYVLLDLVLRTGLDGNLGPAGQSRYLTLLPFIALFGIIYTARLVKSSKFLIYGCIIILTITILGVLSMHSARKDDYAAFGAGMKNSVKSVSAVMKDNEVDLVLAGYWYAAPSKFYSDNTVDFATMTTCQHPAPTYNYRKSFYNTSQNVEKSALIIDRSGPDAIYWQCSDEQIRAIYGEPLKVASVSGMNNSTVQVFIYNYDLRVKLLPRS